MAGHDFLDAIRNDTVWRRLTKTATLPIDAEMIVPVAFYPEVMSPPIEVHIEWSDKAGRHTSMMPVSWSQ